MAAGLDKSARPAGHRGDAAAQRTDEALAHAVQLLKTDRLAVRSSGVDEDRRRFVRWQ
jgi:hypothetical protein